MAAKFQIKQSITIKEKVYVLTTWLEDSDKWILSHSSYLGECPIEYWTEIPRSTDENGQQRMDLFAFVLKHAEHKHKLKEGDIVELWDDYVEIIEAFKLSIPKIIAFIKCYPGKLPTGVIVGNDKNRKWILQDYRHTNSIEGYELIEKMMKENIFEYALQPLDHNEKPQKGEKLKVERPNS